MNQIQIKSILILLIGVSPLSAQTEISDSETCGVNQSAQALAQLIMAHPSQKRPVLNCNTQLSEIAHKRAEDLAKNLADPEITANQVVVDGGFRFPDYYPVTGNQVEAVAKSVTDPSQAITYLVNSNKHHNHVLGKGDFFEIQTEIGVGYYQDDDITNETQWVVLISQGWESPKYKYTQTFTKPGFKNPEECEDRTQLRKSPKLKEKCRALEKERKNEED